MLGLGPDDVRARVSDRRVLRALLLASGVPEDHLGAAFTAIDRITRSNPGVAQEQLDAILEKTVGQLEAGAVVKRVAHLALEVRDREALEAELKQAPGGNDVGQDLFECLDALDAMELGGFVTVDLSIVRGLAYYTGIVFELFDTQQSLRAICGGGRYDGLLGALGGVDLPAVGFGMGDVVLGELLKARGLPAAASRRLDAFLVAVTMEDLPTVLGLAHRLRDRGLSVEFGLREQTIAKQLKIAASRAARRAILVGPDERQKNEVVVRDMERGVEERVPIAALADAPW
ncbi:MAG: ATP phosphoribosyltransferase regulatory subunit [Gemmatimonadetes bacterium]|nr:ATP phosphoribosyltransferase regulatory subunit [Gemmatimonadota bacterium]